jgi:hypothetical protein
MRTGVGVGPKATRGERYGGREERILMTDKLRSRHRCSCMGTSALLVQAAVKVTQIVSVAP